MSYHSRENEIYALRMLPLHFLFPTKRATNAAMVILGDFEIKVFMCSIGNNGVN
jgi:hypothetical protein